MQIKPILDYWRGFMAVIRRLFDRFLDSTLDHYLCYLPGKLGRLSAMLLGIAYARVKLDPLQMEKLAALNNNGVFVFVNRHKSNFEYLFCHTRYRKEGLPFPEIGFDYKVWYWQPLTRLVRILLAKCAYFIKHRKSSNPYSSGYIKAQLLQGRSGFLSIVEKHGFNRRFVKSKIDPMQYLIDMQGEMERPIYLVPHLMIFSRNPHRSRPGLIDLVFGTEEKPGRIRRIFTLIRYYGRICAETTAPVNLKTYLANPQIQALSPVEQGLELRREIILRLDRHRQTITGPVRRSLSEQKENILTNTRMRQFMRRLAEEENTPLFRVHKKADAYLDEMASNMSHTVLHLFASSLTWVFNTMFEGVSYHPEELARIRHISQRANIVYVPSHKSHIDYLILSYLMQRNGIPCPQIAAGKNLSFWPIGPLFRGSGAFFLRRHFKGKKLYAKVFSEYVANLLQEGYSVEFFVEGGRSRTGKLLRPKLGLLSILIDALQNGACQDLAFVPVYIGYDRVPEEGAHIHEIQGGQKKGESLSQVIGARKVLKNRFGKIYIRFHQPLYLNTLLAEGQVTLATMNNRVRQDFVRNLGYSILSAIDRVTVITPHALVASAILNFPQKHFTFNQVVAQVDSLRRYLLAQQVNLADTLLHDHAHAVAHVMETCLSQKLIEPVDGDAKDLDFTVCDYQTVDIRRSMMDYYKNICIAYFVPPAMTALSILVLDRSQFKAADLQNSYCLLQKVFKKEFTYNAENSPDYLIRKSIKAFIDDEILKPHATLPGTYLLIPAGLSKLKLYAGFLKAYFESYLIVLNHFNRTPKSDLPPKERLKKVQSLGNRMFKGGEIAWHESLSTINFKNAIEFFSRRGISSRDDESAISYYFDVLRRYLKHLTRTPG